jgi:hypothetical protein
MPSRPLLPKLSLEINRLIRCRFKPVKAGLWIGRGALRHEWFRV